MLCRAFETWDTSEPKINPDIQSSTLLRGSSVFACSSACFCVKIQCCIQAYMPLLIVYLWSLILVYCVFLCALSSNTKFCKAYNCCVDTYHCFYGMQFQESCLAYSKWGHMCLPLLILSCHFCFIYGYYLLISNTFVCNIVIYLIIKSSMSVGSKLFLKCIINRSLEIDY